MKTLKSVFPHLLVVTGLLFSLVAGAIAEGLADRIAVNDPYVRAVPPVVKTSAVFLQLQNNGADEGLLVGVSSPVATAVELHMHNDDGGIMRMRQVPHIHLPPGETVALAPGGLHIMLFGLVVPLGAGDQVPVRLVFDDGSTKDITALVRATTPR